MEKFQEEDRLAIFKPGFIVNRFFGCGELMVPFSAGTNGE